MHLEEKRPCFVAKLDAVKAFDKLWRDALFLKMKKLNIAINYIIILKVYYDSLFGKVKTNNKFSIFIKLSRGVKQGGVLSGSLFNTFINDLIVECYESGFGASFFDIIMCIIGFCDDIGLMSSSIEDLQALLNICYEYSKKWAIEFNIPKCQYIVFGSNKFDDACLHLGGLQLPFSSLFKYLGIEFTRDLNMSQFFIDKFSSVRKSFFSLNAFGFKPGGVNPFLQSYIYKAFCLSRILYGIEIMHINKKTINILNLTQNSIVRYMTGLSKNSHISNVLKILKIFSIHELYLYMKLIFVKNLKNNIICNKIFGYLLLAKYKDKSTTKSFIKDFKNVCVYINKNEEFVINNINEVINGFKDNSRIYEINPDTEIIKQCLENNQDINMINKLNSVTYAGRIK